MSNTIENEMKFQHLHRPKLNCHLKKVRFDYLIKPFGCQFTTFVTFLPDYDVISRKIKDQVPYSIVLKGHTIRPKKANGENCSFRIDKKQYFFIQNQSRVCFQKMSQFKCLQIFKIMCLEVIQFKLRSYVYHLTIVVSYI